MPATADLPDRRVADTCATPSSLRPKADGACQRRQMEAEGRLQAEQAEQAARQQAADDRVFRAAFRIIDVDGSGTIEAPEVLKTLKIFDRKVNGKAFPLLLYCILLYCYIAYCYIGY
eukprot:SAG31_NODE_5227_length_2662_cov_3.874756_4_plen_117_part_00